MRFEILQGFKGVIGETEFKDENIYDAIYQLFAETDLEERLEILGNEDSDIFVRNIKKVFEMADRCGLDVYNVLGYFINDYLEEKEVLGAELGSFNYIKEKITETEEFKKMNEVYKKTLDVEL